MLQIYPAIDLKEGRCVRLEQGRQDREKIYFENPLEPAKQWKEWGLEWIHVVDLDGAFSGKPYNQSVVEQIVDLGLKVQLGGGLRTEEQVKGFLDRGVSRVVIGTRACEDLSFVERLVDLYGDSIVVGIDAKDGKVATKGWVTTTAVEVTSFAQTLARAGVARIVYTDISRDGMLTGPNFEAQESMLQLTQMGLIASGGVSCLEDIGNFKKIKENYAHLDGVIVGKALYEGKIDLLTLLQN